MKIVILSAILFLTSFTFAGKIADLPEVMQPVDIHVYGNRLYIGENYLIHIYSLKDFKQIKQFGRKGDGPGEFKFNARLNVFPDKLAVNTRGALIYFTHDGELIKMFRTKPEIHSLLPVGSHFAASVYENGTSQKIKLYDKNLKLLMTVYEGSMGQASYWHSDAKKIDVMMVKDFMDERIYNNKIIIGDTSKGFYFSVFDSSGKKLLDVKKDFKPIEIPDTFKQEQIRLQQEKPGWDRIKDKVNLRFPQYFPAYRMMKISGNKIYFVTYEKSKSYGKSMDKVIITDLEGNLLGSASAPSDVWMFCISEDQLYWLYENEEEEIWELHSISVKSI